MRSLGEYSRLTLKTHNLYQRERTFWDYFRLKCSLNIHEMKILKLLLSDTKANPINLIS